MMNDQFVKIAYNDYIIIVWLYDNFIVWLLR